MPLSLLTLLASRIKKARLGMSRKSRRKHCQLELLEQRWLLSTYNWTGAAGDSNWITPGNWDIAGAPQTVNYPGNQGNVGDIALFDSASSNGSFTTPQTANIPSTISMVAVAEVEIMSTVAVTITGGTTAAAGVLQVEGTGSTPGTLAIDSITTNGTTTISAFISAPNGLNDTNVSKGAVIISSTINASIITITNDFFSTSASTISGPITATGAVNIINNSTGPSTISGILTAPGGLNVTMNGNPNTGNLTLSSQISAAQGVNATVNDGILLLNNAGSQINGGDSTYTVGTHGQLAGGPNTPAEFGGGATFILLNDSTFKSNNVAGEAPAGNIIIGSPTVNSGNASVTFLNGGINLTGSTVILNGNDTILLMTTSATFNGYLMGANAAGDSLTLTTSGSTTSTLDGWTFTGSNPLTIRGTNTFTMNGSTPFTVEVPTAIQNAIGGTGPLTVTGTSPLTLSGKDLFSGGTSVQNGELLIDSSVSLSGGIMVNGNSTLGGIGTTVALTVPGGTVIPGDPSIGNGNGILTAASADFTGGGTLVIALSGYSTPGTNYDQLSLVEGSSTGTLNLDTSSSITLNLAELSAGGTTLPGPGIILDNSGSSQFTNSNVNVINDNTQNSSTATLDYSVVGEVNVDVASAPVITSASFTTFTVNGSSTFTVTAVGYPTATFTETGSLPSGVTLNTNGVLSGTPAPGTAGTYNDIITAMNSSGSTTQSFALTANAIATTTTLTDLGGGGAGAATLSFAGSSVSFTTAVNAPGSVAGDTVVLEDATSNGDVSVGSGTLNSAGSATITANGLTVGSHSIFALYTGDATFAPSQSNIIVQVVQNTGVTDTTLEDLGPNPSILGSSVTFTTAVVAGTQSSVAGETVTLEDASNGNATVGSGTLNSSGAATITVSTLAVGSHSIFAVYGGDRTNSPSQSSPDVLQTVESSTTTTLTINGPNPSLDNQVAYFTVNVASGTAVTSGTVTLEDVSNGDATVGTVTLTSGSATISGSFAMAGTHDIFAVYSGDATHAASQSSQVAQTVVALTSGIVTLPTYEPTNSFTVSWSGTDGATGGVINGYTIYVSDNFGPYTPWLTDTTQTSAVYPGQNDHTYSFYSIATDNLGNVQATPSFVATTTVHSILVTDLTVTSFTPTPTGFTATFSEPFLNTSTNPIHLYSAVASNANYGPADVTIVGENTGAVTGSLIVNATNTGFTFIKTNVATGGASAGLLTPDIYTVTFLSSPTGFQDSSGTGNLLDGTDSGVPGANYITTFAVMAPAANTVTVSIPDFARGPDSADSIDIGNNTSNGIPVSLSDGSGVTTGSVTVTYNPSLLTVSGAFPNTSLGSASFTLDPASTPGIAILDFNNPTPLSAGPVTLGGLIAYTPDSAVYKSKELLQISSSLNSGTIPTIDDNAVQVVAYLGNVSGSGFYSGLDSGEMLNIISGSDAGFSQFPVIDPAILGGITGDSQVSISDILQLNSRIATGSNPYVPVYPGLPSNNPAGPDPTLSIPSALTVNADGTILVPVDIDDADPAGSTGMTVAQLALKYDPAEFSVTPQDVQLGSVPEAGAGWTIRTVIDASTGTIGITLSSATPISSAAGGSLAVIALQELPTAPLGETVIEVVASVTANGQVYSTSVNDGQGPFTLTPTPSNSGAAPGLEGTVVLPVASIPQVAVGGTSAALPELATLGSLAPPTPSVVASAAISDMPVGVIEDRVEYTSVAVSDVAVEADTSAPAYSMELSSDHGALPFAQPVNASIDVEAGPVNSYVFTANASPVPSAGGNPLLSLFIGQSGNVPLPGSASATSPAGQRVADQLFQNLALGETGPAPLGVPSSGDWLRDDDRPLDLLSQKGDEFSAADLGVLDGYFAQISPDSE